MTSGSSTGRSAQPSSGNSTNVVPTTTRCSRQCDSPATMASRESLAPCKKNNNATAATVMPSSAWAATPEAGNTLARVTVPSKAKVKLSGRKRERAMGDSAAAAQKMQKSGAYKPQRHALDRSPISKRNGFL